MSRLHFDNIEAAQAWANRSRRPEVKPRLLPTEEQEQMALIARIRLYEGTYPALKYLFHCPNGGSRNAIEAKKLKALGVLRGVPDLLLLYPAHGYHGWCGELKAIGGTVTLEQKRMLRELRHRGYFAEVFFGQDAAWQSLLWYVGGKETV